jgi:hypothetical protein
MFGISHPRGAAKPRTKKQAAAAPDATAERLISVPLKMSSAQHEKLLALGGAAWVRACIDKASPPAD